MARGEFALILVSLAAAAGLDARLVPFVGGYVLVLAILSPLFAAQSNALSKLVPTRLLPAPAGLVVDGSEAPAELPHTVGGPRPPRLRFRRFGRLAQMVRALPSHGRGHRFESCIAHLTDRIDGNRPATAAATARPTRAPISR